MTAGLSSFAARTQVINMEYIEKFSMDDGLDPNPSPSSDEGMASTPDTPFTPLESPFSKSTTSQNPRLSARTKLAQLTLEEKVEAHSHARQWRC